MKIGKATFSWTKHNSATPAYPGTELSVALSRTPPAKGKTGAASGAIALLVSTPQY